MSFILRWNVLKWSIVGASIGAATLSFLMAWLHVIDWKWTRHPGSIDFAVIRAAQAVIIGLVAESVARLPFIPNEWRPWLYLAGLVGFTVAMLRVVRRTGKIMSELRKFRKEEL